MYQTAIVRGRQCIEYGEHDEWLNEPWYSRHQEQTIGYDIYSRGIAGVDYIQPERIGVNLNKV